MTKLVNLFKGTVGINNKVDPVRLRFNPETGITQLTEGVNIDIDETGRINRRKGYGRERIEAGHSLWADGEDCFYVSGNSLYRVLADFTRVGIRSDLSDKPFSFVKVNDEVFYSNGNENGVIRANTSYAWKSNVKPTGYITTRLLSPPPKGSLLAYNSGRILIASGNVLWYTEPFAYYWCDLGKDFISISSIITMLAPVEDGIFIGTENSILFLSGKDIETAELVKVANYGIAKGTMAQVDSRLLNAEFRAKGFTYIWTSKKGVCLGTAGGQFFNLTDKSVILPSAQSGAGLCIGDRYVGLLNP